jgi:predicted AlkP superfamily phosphohydrolase/phosphomutase
LTGAPPAAHGIHDFITKARGSYLPTIGLFSVRGGLDGIPVYSSRRTISTLGEHLRDAGLTAYILKVPGTFPPTPIRGGMLAGFGMPDLLGTFGVSAWYTTDPAGKKARAPEGAELICPLVPVDPGTWRGEIAGPSGTKRTFVLRRDGYRVNLSFASNAGRPIAVLSAREWSGWVRLSFDVPGRGAIDGMFRFKLVRLGQDIELYRTPVQCVPGAPLFPLSEPAGFGAWLADLVGPYATLGMPADLDGVRRGVVDLDTFLQDAYANWEQQVEMTLRLMEGSSWDLLMTHLFTIDNVQHLFWHCQDPLHPAYSPQIADRFGGEIERAYRWLDAQLGRLLQHVDSDTTLLLVSDHGGVPIYRLIYLNAWLGKRGYLVPRENKPAGTAARLDWGRTRAAMFGTGGIWLNVQGRDPRGIVPQGAPYKVLRQEISQALSSWRDPQTGQPVIKKVFNGEAVFGPGAVEDGPDLVPALQPGYGLGRGEGLGRVMPGTPTIVPNHGPWSGGHEGPYLPSDVPGICILSGDRVPVGVSLPQAGLQDIAPTVLHLLGLDIAVGMDGRSLVQAGGF